MNQDIVAQLPQLMELAKTIGTETFQLTVAVLWFQAVQIKIGCGLTLLAFFVISQKLLKKTTKAYDDGDAESLMVFGGPLAGCLLVSIPLAFEFFTVTTWYGILVNPNVLAVLKFLN